MLQFKIKEFIMEKGHALPSKWLITKCGMTKNKAYDIINGRKKSLDLEDFTRICKVIDCTPDELLYWKQTPRHTLPEGHSCLTKLRPPDGNEDWSAFFGKLSSDEIADIRKYALRKIKKK